MTHRTREVDEIDLREIAAELRRDIRTVRRVARGEAIRGIIATAEIQRAISARLNTRERTRSTPPGAA